MCKSYGCDGIKEIRYYSMGGGERNNEPFNNGGGWNQAVIFP